MYAIRSYYVGTDQDYITTDADPANSGDYFCILTNSCGVVSTDTVNVEIRALPVVTVQPVGDEVCVGESVQMEIEATGAAPLDFLWYRNGSAVSGETNNIISYTSAQVNQTGDVITSYSIHYTKLYDNRKSPYFDINRICRNNSA